MSTPDFWPDCGFHLAGRDAEGRLLASPAFIRAGWQRPEVAPVEESLPAERALHAALLDDPQRPETEAELAMIRDLGCTKIQGFFFGRPLPVNEARALATRHRATARAA